MDIARHTHYKHFNRLSFTHYCFRAVAVCFIYFHSDISVALILSLFAPLPAYTPVSDHMPVPLLAPPQTCLPV